MEASQKPKIKFPNDPAVPFLDMYPKELKLEYQRDICITVY
jgi:hypothetical protein